MQLYYPQELPNDLNAAVEKILWFYRCGDKETEQKKGSAAAASKREYDFEQDADVLYTSFMIAYGIDLSTAQMHWWAFRKLMYGLPEETPFMQRVMYRTADTSAMPKRKKEHFQKMKQLYALKTDAGTKETLQERNSRMKDYVARRFLEAGEWD